MRNCVTAILIVLAVCCAPVLSRSVQAATEGTSSDLRTAYAPLQLTPQEQAWVDAHPVIRISGPRSFPPFHYFEADGELKGMALDYMLTLSQMIGIKVEVQKNLNWPEVLRRMRDGELDAISCLAYTKQREAYISFSDPYLSFPLVIIARRDSDFISGQKDLHNRRIACIKGAVACDWLARDGIEFVSYPVTTQLEALESVSLGKADFFLGNLAASTYQIEKKGLANLKVAAPTNYGNYDLFIGIRKDWPQLLSLFNKALANMKPEDHTRFRNRWMRVEFEYGIRISDVIKWGTLAAVIGLIILVGFGAWNWRLSQEISRRQSVVASLKNETEFSKAVLRWVHSIVVVMDAEGRMVVFNNAAEECSGYSHSEVLDKPFWEILILPEEVEAVKKRTDKVLADRTTTTSINFWVTKNRGKRLIQWRNSPLMKPDGSVGFVLCTGLDITEQKQAEEARTAIREKLAHALEATGASIWEWNLKRDVIDIGDEIIQQLGYEKDELVLTPEGMSVIVADESVMEFASLADLHREDDTQICTIEVKVRAKNGEWHWLRSQTKVYRWDEDNVPEVLLGSLLDITEIRRTQEIIIQTEKMLSVGGLAAGMAHELNNPLGAILMGIQNIIRRLEPGQKKNLAVADNHGIDLAALQLYLEEQKILASFDGIRDAGMRAADIIANMLQFSRASNSKFEAVELTRLVDNTLKLAENDFSLKKRMDFKQVEIIKEFDPSLPSVICTETEIRQVLLNLIINAFQAMATEEGDRPKQLALRTRQETSFVVLEVEDNGPGMDEDVRKRVFEPFYTTKPVGFGTGLGLSVAYMIITNNHNGSIEVHSVPNEGTRFVIKLPIDSSPKA